VLGVAHRYIVDELCTSVCRVCMWSQTAGLRLLADCVRPVRPVRSVDSRMRLWRDDWRVSRSLSAAFHSDTAGGGSVGLLTKAGLGGPQDRGVRDVLRPDIRGDQ